MSDDWAPFLASLAAAFVIWLFQFGKQPLEDQTDRFGEAAASGHSHSDSAGRR